MGRAGHGFHIRFAALVAGLALLSAGGRAQDPDLPKKVEKKAPPKAGAPAMSAPGRASRMPSCAITENSVTARAPAAAG